MKFFISQPMKGKTPEAIKAEREYLKEQAIKATDGRCEFIESYKPGLVGGSPVAALSASIAMLADADMAIFAHGWEQANGCCIEHEVAQRYGIKCVYAEPAPVVAKDEGYVVMDGMDAQREGKILEDAVATFGSAAQVIVAIEEMSELQRALCKLYRNRTLGQGDYDEIMANVREEMADVNIMLGQLHFIFGDVTEEETAKLLRLEKLIADATSNER